MIILYFEIFIKILLQIYILKTQTKHYVIFVHRNCLILLLIDFYIIDIRTSLINEVLYINICHKNQNNYKGHGKYLTNS